MRPHCCVGSPTTRPESTGRAVRHRTQDPAVPARGGRALTGRRASINGHWGPFAADGRARGWPRMSSLADADASIPTMSVQAAAPGQRGPPRNPMNPTATPTYDRKWPDPQAGGAERSSTTPPPDHKGLAQGSPLAAPGKRQSKEEVPVLIRVGRRDGWGCPKQQALQGGIRSGRQELRTKQSEGTSQCRVGHLDAMHALQAAARSPPPAEAAHQRSLDVGMTTRRGGGHAAATSQGQASEGRWMS